MRKPGPSAVASDGTGQGGRAMLRSGCHRSGGLSVRGLAFTVRASALAMKRRNALDGRPRAMDQGAVRTAALPRAVSRPRGILAPDRSKHRPRRLLHRGRAQQRSFSARQDMVGVLAPASFWPLWKRRAISLWRRHLSGDHVDLLAGFVVGAAGGAAVVVVVLVFVLRDGRLLRQRRQCALGTIDGGC